MEGTISVHKNVAMEMRDGTLLRADIYRPEDVQKHPAILIRTPYDKVTQITNDKLNIVEFAHAGYAVVVQDVRGRFASDGEWKRTSMFTIEGPDGYDSVEWIARQPWCDGNVGMAGMSYLAGLQWAAAMENPPHLKAIAPWAGIWGAGMEPRPTGGAILLSVAASATPMMAVDVADRLEKAGQDVAELRRSIEWAMANPDEVINYLPLKDIPFARFESIRPLWDLRLYPPPKAEAEKRQRLESVTVPCFYGTGWYDIIEWATFDSYKLMRVRGGSPVAREGQHILAGPWMHGKLQSALGDINFGPYADGLQARVHEHHLAFFDRYLRGRDVQIPAVQYFLMGENLWHTAEDWPLPQTKWQRFYLHSKGNANTAYGDGVLSQEECGVETPDIFVYNPHRPVPTVGGRIVGYGLVPGPVEQSFVEKRHDVLCYSTAQLEEDMEVTGPIEMHLFAATSATDTDFTAKLIDVHPDGRTYNVVEGIIRASGRSLDGQRKLLNPGEVYEYVIWMGNTSQLYRQGHRIRIEISSSNFPAFDRNMNTGNRIGEDAFGVPAMQSVYHQKEYASYIDLPIIPKK